MAYDFIPKKADDIRKNPSFVRKMGDKITDVIAIYEALAKLDPEKQPIALDPVGSNKNISIRRSLMGVAAQEVLTSPAAQQLEFKKALKKIGVVTDLNFKWGDGSRGNKGTKNRGIGFEAEIVADFEKWKRGEKILKRVNETFIRELIKEYDLTKASEIVIVAEGAMNKPRPLNVSSGSFYVGNSKRFDIGATVTDVTVEGKYKSRPDKTVYLSLKRGDTVAYFNAGLAGIINESDTKAGKLSTQAKNMLSHLGIDTQLFKDTFTPEKTPSKPIAVVKNAPVNKRMLQELLRSGVGYGFHMVHLFDKRGGFIKHFNVSDTYARQAATLTSPVTIYYGGSTSTYSKTIRLTFSTQKYRKVDLLIRNKKNARMFPVDFVSNFYY